MWRVSILQVDIRAEIERDGDPDLCSAAIAAGMSLLRLMALMRVSSGAIGLAPSRSTDASSRPLAQKSPSSLDTPPCATACRR